MPVTNRTDIHLALAAWLAYDGYDHSDDPKEISVTSLIKPLKQTILAARVPPQNNVEDIVGRVASATGTAIHDSIEAVWATPEKIEKSLKSLGLPKKIRDRIVVNPSDEVLATMKNPIAVYVEIRSKKKVGKWIVSGKFDIVFDAEVGDFKSTKAYSYMKGNKVLDYKKQGSMYRWLNPDKIKKDTMKIHYIITDFSPVNTYQQGYPEQAVFSKTYDLASYEDTQEYVESRLAQLEKLWNAPESEMEPCSEEDLWMDPPKFKYYKDPTKKARSTKNFDDMHSARQYQATTGKGAGLIDVVYGEVKACKYCAAFHVCQQKDEYLRSGQLKM